jgi:hypothetical protein
MANRELTNHLFFGLRTRTFPCTQFSPTTALTIRATNQPTNHQPTINQPTNHGQSTNQPRINQPTRRLTKWPRRKFASRANPRLIDTHVRLTDAELAKIAANQKKAGHSSIAAYMRAMALDDGQLSERDKSHQRLMLQAHTKVAGMIARGLEAGWATEADMDEIKRMIGELVR